MVKRQSRAVGVAAGCAIVFGLIAGAGKWPSAQVKASVRGASRLPGVQQWAGRPSAGAVAGQARSAFRQAVARVSGTRGAYEAAAGGTLATSGGVIPLEHVPIDQLSEWELDLLTTPDS